MDAKKCDVCGKYFEYTKKQVRYPLKLIVSFQTFGHESAEPLKFDVCGTCAGTASLSHFTNIMKAHQENARNKAVKQAPPPRPAADYVPRPVKDTMVVWKE